MGYPMKVTKMSDIHNCGSYKSNSTGKALIKKRDGEWICFRDKGPSPTPIGNGSTPLRAYNWWMEQCSRYGDGQGSYWTKCDEMELKEGIANV